jgi:adenylyltransferase/sulfurtransferase
MNKPWVDGAIQELLGLARVFVPGQGACFECTLTEQARRELSLRYSCPLLARQNILLGKVPTTPTIASIIGGIQSQEALKLIHDMPVEAGKVIHFNGLTNDLHTSAYVPQADCESHWSYGEVVELPARAEHTTLADMLRIARADLGPQAVIELDQELILSLLRETRMTHLITGDETFLHRTLASVGVPKLHILRANNEHEFRFYELTGDLPEALHFRHFEGTAPDSAAAGRIRLGEAFAPDAPRGNPAHGRIMLKPDGAEDDSPG